MKRFFKASGTVVAIAIAGMTAATATPTRASAQMKGTMGEGGQMKKSMKEDMQAPMKGLRVGDKAPTPTVRTLDGKPADLASYIGKKPVLIEFWATWCPLCKELEPTIQNISDTYKDQLEIVHIVVPQNQTPEKAREYAEKHKLPGLFFFDADGSAYKAFAAYHTSYIVVLDRNGVVVHSDAGTTQDLTAAAAKAVQ